MSPFSSSSPTNEFPPPGVLQKRASPLPPLGAMALLIGSLIVGILLGALYHLVARWMDLVVLFPLGFGLVLGALMAIPIYAAKIRVRPFVICCAVLASVFLIGTRLFCDSLEAREAMIQNLSSSWSRAGNANALSPAKADAILRRRVSPLRYFTAYLKDAAQSGVVIGDVGKSSSAGDLVLSGPWFWASQILNLVLVSAMAIGATLNYAGAPFCESCRKWLEKPREVTKVHPDQSAELLEKLKLKDWESAGAIAGKNMDDKHQSVVSVASCSSCGQTRLKVKTTRGAMPKTVLEMPISSQDATRLRHARAKRL